MMLILLALAGQGRPRMQPMQPPGPPPPIVVALSNYIKSAKSLSAEITLSGSNMKDVGTVRMVYVKPDKIFYSFKWKGIDFEFVANDKGAWDADLAAKTYNETPEWGWYYPYSIESDAPMIYTPGFLMDGTLHTEKIGALAVIGHETINGVEAVKLGDRSGLSKAVLYVDHNGKPLRSVTFRGHIQITADIKSLVINGPEPSSLFTYNPPLGFQSFTVPLTLRPIGIGDKFPVSGWKSAGLAEMFAQKPTLVVVTEEGCEPSAKSAAALANIGKRGTLNVAVVSLSPNGGVPSSLSQFPKFYDAAGRLDKAIGAPATPLFYLIDKDGKVAKVWMGFDPGKADEFEKDVADSAK